MTNGGRRIYLDYNASAPLLPEARDALVAALDAANPSSVHADGRRARAMVERARASVAQLVGAPPENAVFTSGASEAATQALSTEWSRSGEIVRVSSLAVIDTDHPCIRDGGRFAPDAVTRLPVDGNGVVDIGALSAWCAALEEGGTAVLALTLANSETGVVQPVAAIREAISGRDVLLVVDAVQAAGRVPIDVPSLGADAVLLSGHKLGAAKGVGALVLREETTRPLPLVRGGGQEKGRRAGTEPVPAIGSFGAAADVVRRHLDEEPDTLPSLRRHLELRLRKICTQALILGEGAERVPNTVAIATPGLKAETAQIALDLDGIAVSAGSACSSGKVGPSHVVAAMARGGLLLAPEDGAIRVSFGHATLPEEIDRFVEAYAAVAGRAGAVPREQAAA